MINHASEKKTVSILKADNYFCLIKKAIWELLQIDNDNDPRNETNVFIIMITLMILLNMI